LLSSLHCALILAYVAVGMELIMEVIRNKNFRISSRSSIAQVVFGGARVFLAAVLIGSSG